MTNEELFEIHGVAVAAQIRISDVRRQLRIVTSALRTEGMGETYIDKIAEDAEIIDNVLQKWLMSFEDDIDHFKREMSATDTLEEENPSVGSCPSCGTFCSGLGCVRLDENNRCFVECYACGTRGPKLINANRKGAITAWNNLRSRGQE